MVHWIRMFARYVSHRASRRSCACSPCSKEGTRATESKSCRGTKKDGKAESNSAQEALTEWVNSLKGPKSCHKETPLPHEDY